MFFFIMIADAICLLTAVAHALFFPASLPLNFFDVLAYAICLLSRQHRLSGF